MGGGGGSKESGSFKDSPGVDAVCHLTNGKAGMLDRKDPT
jgi:hypothetical protein